MHYGTPECFGGYKYTALRQKNPEVFNKAGQTLKTTRQEVKSYLEQFLPYRKIKTERILKPTLQREIRDYCCFLVREFSWRYTNRRIHRKPSGTLRTYLMAFRKHAYTSRLELGYHISKHAARSFHTSNGCECKE